MIAAEPRRRLTLQMDMKAPGAGVLEFTIQDLGERREISVTAYWHPAGVAGQLYWLALIPAHRFLFRGLVERLASRAEAAPDPAGPAHD